MGGLFSLEDWAFTYGLLLGSPKKSTLGLGVQPSNASHFLFRARSVFIWATMVLKLGSTKSQKSRVGPKEEGAKGVE
jgi:hypothetical protein